jgi:sugar lactone lactonase YvrE
MQPKILASDLAFGEWPRWHCGRLWLADWGLREIIAIHGDGNRQVAVQLPPASFQAICFDWLPDGRLLLVASQDGALLRVQPDKTLVKHADLSATGRGWNKIVVDGRGNAIVNAGSFDLRAGDKVGQGVVVLVTPGGGVGRVADGLAFANCMAVTADNSTLIVAESYAKKLTAFDIGGDGGLSNRRTWAEFNDCVSDGICIDADGAVWYADVPNKRCTRVRRWRSASVH